MSDIYIGADHNGFILKQELISKLEHIGFTVIDEGDSVLDPQDDFPKFAQSVSLQILSHPGSRGILICGSGQGMAMAANRNRGIRASVVWDVEEARLTRNENDSNILVLSSRILKDDLQNGLSITRTWLDTPFAAAARYIRRNHELDA